MSRVLSWPCLLAVLGLVLVLSAPQASAANGAGQGTGSFGQTPVPHINSGASYTYPTPTPQPQPAPPAPAPAGPAASAPAAVASTSPSSANNSGPVGLGQVGVAPPPPLVPPSALVLSPASLCFPNPSTSGLGTGAPVCGTPAAPTPPPAPPAPATLALAPAAPAAAPAVTPAPSSPQQLALQAEQETRLPVPEIEMWPPAAKQIVNFPTWLHVANWGAASASASAGPVTSTVTATPTSVTFSAPNSINGGATYQTISVTCQGPGPVYNFSVPDSTQHSSCTLTWSWPSVNYRFGGTYPLTATVSYAVTWVATGAPGGGSLGTVTTTTTIPLTVDEIEAIGVPTK